MEKVRDNSSMATGKSQEQEGGYSRSTERQKENPLCYIDGHLSSQKCGVRTNISDVQRHSRAPWRHCKRRLWSVRMDVIARSPDCDGQTADAASAYTQVKLGGRSQIAQNSWVRMSRYMDTYRNRLFSQVKTYKIKAQYQCRHLQQDRRLRVLQDRWNCRRTTWSDSKDSNIGIAIRQIPWSTIVFSVENSIQKSSDYLIWFFFGCFFVNQRSGDGWFSGTEKHSN